MAIKPLADRVLIEPAAAEGKDNRRNHHPRHSKRKTVAGQSSSYRQWHKG